MAPLLVGRPDLRFRRHDSHSPYSGHSVYHLDKSMIAAYHAGRGGSAVTAWHDIFPLPLPGHGVR
ncbi:MAG TPA: hypothetical protein DCX12_13620 [Chloroflexi bacterium]|nr:hypothetical protein [Chloroflexota bacterium]